MEKHQKLEAFRGQVSQLIEKDYGDWKRKVGLYLIRLKDETGSARGGDFAKGLAEIESVVVYSPNFDIESTRAKVDEICRRLIQISRP